MKPQSPNSSVPTPATLGSTSPAADQLGPDLVERFRVGALVDVEEYLAARSTARIASRRLALLFADVDVLLTPVMAGGPPSIERPDDVDHGGATIAFRDLVMGYTVPQNLTGCPSVVVPVGVDQDGLPVRLQVTAEWGREGVALAAASAIGGALAGMVPAPSRLHDPAQPDTAAQGVSRSVR
ncbi:MAG: amidase [Actinomycetota bacterium]|nr:amidase [Actinomycetota bacterium]